MDRRTSASGLRCRPGDLARIVTSTNPALIGVIVEIEGLRLDGRWDVLLEKPAFGFTYRGKRPVATREFAFWDASLEPLPRCERCVSRQLADLRPDQLETMGQIVQATH